MGIVGKRDDKYSEKKPNHSNFEVYCILRFVIMDQAGLADRDVNNIVSLSLIVGLYYQINENMSLFVNL